MRYVLTVEIRETLGDFDDLVDIVDEYGFFTEEDALADAPAVLKVSRELFANELQGAQYIYLALMAYDEYYNIQWVDDLEEINKEWQV